MANEFLQFAGGVGANVLSQASYAALTTILANGYTAGTALSQQLNKTWRQSAAMACAWGGIVDANGFSALDDGNIANLRTAITNALKAICLPLTGGTVASGDVGIGTVTGTAAATTTKLKVKQSAASRGLVIEQNGSNDSNLRLHLTGSEVQVMASYSTTGSYQPLGFYTSDVKRIHIAVAGEVGIGVVPTGGRALDVLGQIVSTKTAANFRAVNATANGAGSFGANSGVNGGATLSGENGHLDFFADGANRARLGSVGLKLGAGSTDATQPLDVAGMGLFTLANSQPVRALSGNAANYASIGVGRTASEVQLGVAAAANNFATGTVAGDSVLAGQAGKKLFLAAGSGPALSIDDAENVLVLKGGVTANLADFNTRNLAASGYQRLPGGLILQWGTIADASVGIEHDFGLVSFPIAFPTAVLCAGATLTTQAASASLSDSFAVIRTLTLTQIRIYAGSAATGTVTQGVRWFALGH